LSAESAVVLAVCEGVERCAIIGQAELDSFVTDATVKAYVQSGHFDTEASSCQGVILCSAAASYV